MFELAKILSFWIVFATGVGGLVWLMCYIWDRVFSYVCTLFKLKKEFLDFVRAKYIKKITPKE